MLRETQTDPWKVGGGAPAVTPRATKAPMKAINCTILNAPRVRWAAIKAIIWSGVEVDEDGERRGINNTTNRTRYQLWLTS